MAGIPSSTSAGHKSLSERASFALSRLQEDVDVEFKRSTAWESIRHGLTKSALAMANLPRGGIVVLGVAEDKDEWHVDGVLGEHLGTFDPDLVRDQINAFASPAIQITLVRHPWTKGTDLLVMEVRPFETVPVVCKKHGPDGAGLVAGTLYIRPAGGKPESRPIRTADELHELLDRAAEFRSRRFLERADRLGMRAEAADRQRFDAELGNL